MKLIILFLVLTSVIMCSCAIEPEPTNPLLTKWDTPYQVPPFGVIREEYYQIGDQAYSNVLSGFLTPEEAVCRFGLQVIDLQGYEEQDVSLPVDCLTNEIQEDS